MSLNPLSTGKSVQTWACNELNTASKKAALNGGLKFSHKLYVKDTENWAFEPFEEMVRVTEIYST